MSKRNFFSASVASNSETSSSTNISGSSYRSSKSSRINIQFPDSEGPLELVGREQEQKTLKKAYNQILERPGSGIVLVKGNSGSGKTALIHTLRESINENTIFCHGKFDLLLQNNPYSALIDAFTELIEQILLSANVEELRESVQQAMGEADKTVLTNFLPPFQDLIGNFCKEQPRPRRRSSLGNFESLNQFQFIFREFAKSISLPSQPVVIFIDDLQWADCQSLDLIQLLLTDPDLSNFLFVGSYRDNEVLPHHPLRATIQEIQTSRSNHSHLPQIQSIHINNLDPQTVNLLLSRLLKIPSHNSDTSQPLASVIHEKTAGNVFFVLQFLDMLKHDKRFLVYDRFNAKWTWNLENIRMDTHISDNLAELVTKRLKRSDQQTQEALRVAACLGFKFSVDTLDHILTNLNVEENTKETLKKAQKAQLITKTEQNGIYRFVHDRIHKGAYSLTPEGKEQELLHWKIGVILWKELQSKQSEEKYDLFLAAQQLNRGVAQIKETDEDISKVELAKINLKAATNAVSKSAHFHAKEFLDSGIQLLPPETCWQDQYELTQCLIEKAAQVECVLGNYDNSKQHINAMLANAKTQNDKLPSYQTMVDCLGGMGEVKEQLKVGTKILRNELGLKQFPKKPTLLQSMLFWVRKIKKQAKAMTDEELLNLPKMNDKNKHDVLSLINALCICAFQVEDNAMLLSLMLHSFHITLTYGISDHAGHSFALYGAFLALLEKFDEAYRFAVLSEKIQETLDNPIGDARLHLNNQLMTLHWRRPIHDSVEPLLKSHRTALEVGDIIYAMNNVSLYGHYYLCCGLELGPIERDLRAYNKQMAAYKQYLPLQDSNVRLQYVLNLRGQSKDPMKLTGEIMDEGKKMLSAKQSKNKYMQQSILWQKMVLCIIFGHWDEAHRMVKDMYQLGTVTKALLSWHYVYIAEVIIYINKARNTGKQNYKKKAIRKINMIRNWVSKGAVNLTNKLYLLEAEYASLSEDPIVVQLKYDRAIAACRRTGFMNDEALSCERAGIYFKDVVKGNDSAENYFSRSYERYQSWGATAKCVQMIDLYPFLSRKNQSQDAPWRGPNIRAVQKYDQSNYDRLTRSSILMVNSQTSKSA